MNRIKSPAMKCKRKTLNQNTRLLLQLVVIGLFFSIVLSGCEESEMPEKLVDEIDITELRDVHLEDYDVYVNENVYKDKVKLAVFDNFDNKSFISMYYEVCSSHADAESTLNGIFDDMPGQVIGEPYDGEYIGEKFWWTLANPVNQVVNMVFLRYNVYFILISSDVDTMIEFAKNIDKDLLSGASYISFL